MIADMPLSSLAGRPAFDPALSKLFASSDGPVQPPKQRRKLYQASYEAAPQEDTSSRPKKKHDAIRLNARSARDESDDSSEELERLSVGSQSSEDEPQRTKADSSEDESFSQRPQRKRKRSDARDDLEAKYFDRLGKREDVRSRNETEGETRDGAEETVSKASSPNNDDDDDNYDVTLESLGVIPVHESLAHDANTSTNEDKSDRTVFLGNVSTLAITSKHSRKLLLAHLSSQSKNKVESLRFRSVAYNQAVGIPKRASFAKADLMTATTASTNAYAIYAYPQDARQAAQQLNGTIVLDRHLRADYVAAPSKPDPKRCVFVGNLDYVDDDAAIKASNDDIKAARGGNVERRTKSGNRGPADVEEGLWREFGKIGTVESVRVVRDAATRVGKGFAYVQFTNANSVEAALLHDGKKFPPLLPRRLRVSRAKSIKRNAKASAQSNGQSRISNSNRMKRGTLKPRRDSRYSKSQTNESAGASAKHIIFEGHRASRADGKEGLKLGKGRNTVAKKRKLSEKGKKRAAAWREQAKKSN